MNEYQEALLQIIQTPVKIGIASLFVLLSSISGHLFLTPSYDDRDKGTLIGFPVILGIVVSGFVYGFYHSQIFLLASAIGFYLAPILIDLFWSAYHYGNPLKVLLASEHSPFGPSNRYELDLQVDIRPLSLSLRMPKGNTLQSLRTARYWKPFEDGYTRESETTLGLTTKEIITFDWGTYKSRGYLSKSIEREEEFQLTFYSCTFDSETQLADQVNQITTHFIHEKCSRSSWTESAPTLEFCSEFSREGIMFKTLSANTEDYFFSQFTFVFIPISSSTMAFGILDCHLQHSNTFDRLSSDLIKSLKMVSKSDTAVSEADHQTMLEHKTDIALLLRDINNAYAREKAKEEQDQLDAQEEFNEFLDAFKVQAPEKES